MASESSFDVVSKVDRQEVDNALNQAAKEIAQRYDFKGVGASIAWSGESILMVANSSERVLAILDVLQTKLIKRGISLKALDLGDGEPKPSGKEYRLAAGIKEGLSSEVARKLAKIVRDEGPKGVKTQIQGDELRVSAKSRDDLQAVIALLKAADVDALQGKDVTFQLPTMKIPFTVEGFLLSFSLPNFYFHATTAYDILRTKGVPLGKRDFLGRMRIKS